MKVSKPIILLFILVVVLLISVFVGSVTKEGILVKDVSILKALIDGVDDTNADYVMSTIKKMQVNDANFTRIVNDPQLTDSQKIIQLKSFVGYIMMDKVKNGSLSNAMNQDITLPPYK